MSKQLNKSSSLVEKNISFFNQEINKKATLIDNENKINSTSEENKILGEEGKGMSFEISSNKKEFNKSNESDFYKSLQFNHNVVKNINISIQGLNNNLNNMSLFQDRASKESLFDRVINQVKEKNKNNKYNFKYHCKKSNKLEESFRNNIVDKSNTFIIIPDQNSSKDNINSSLSIEKQNSQLQIITNKDCISHTAENFAIQSDISKSSINKSENKGDKSYVSNYDINDKKKEEPKSKVFEGEDLQDEKEYRKRIDYTQNKENQDFNKNEYMSREYVDLKKKASYLNQNVESLFSSKTGKIKNIGTKNFFVKRNSKSNNQGKMKMQASIKYDINTEEGLSSYLKKKQLEMKMKQHSTKPPFFDKDKKKHNNLLNANLDRPKHVDKE